MQPITPEHLLPLASGIGFRSVENEPRFAGIGTSSVPSTPHRGSAALKGNVRRYARPSRNTGITDPRGTQFPCKSLEPHPATAMNAVN